MFKLDRFTLIVIGIVAALIVAAIITVNRSGGGNQSEATYLTEDTPAATVYNAFLAFQKGDRAKLREQYSKSVLEQVDKNDEYGPLGKLSTITDGPARRLRILSGDIDSADPTRATVVYEIDNYSSGGLFDSGSTWSSKRTVPLVREENHWKIDVMEYFY